MRRIGIQMHAIPGLEPEAYVKISLFVFTEIGCGGFK